MSEEEIRRIAPEYAVKVVGDHTADAECVLVEARKFEAFLKGEADAGGTA